MGYRNETEQLRARVEQLEAQVGAIRGHVSGDRAAQFAARVRRQAWLIGAVGVLASGLSLLCFVPVAATYARYDRVSVEEVVERPAEGVDEVAMDLVLDPLSVGEIQSGLSATAAADPRLLVYCHWGRCPSELANWMSYFPEQMRRPRRFALTGTIESARPGTGQTAAELATYAASIGEPVTSLRIFRPARRQDPKGTFWICLVLTLVVVLGAGGAFVLHRRGVREEPDLPTADDFLPKSPVVASLLYLFTGVYQFYWVYRTTAALRRLTGRPDLVPAVDLVLSICTLGFWSFWAYYRNAEAIDEVYEAHGEPTGVRTSVVGYTMASFVCGLAYVGLVHELQSQYNRLAAFQADAMRDVLEEDDVA